ncbi:MAG: hypothetical protein FJZ63_06020, partial [Chlamydiae bacterium]|nr:hypothetical protein [Chlamydiota bacterium]
MRIEIYNTLLLLKWSCAQLSEAVWQDKVITHFRPMLEKVPLNFSAMGACDFSTPLDSLQDVLDVFERNRIVERIEKALQTALEAFHANGSFSFPDTLKVGIFAGNGKNAIHEKLNHGFSGFGGIPGFIVLILSPTDYVLKSIEALVAHEFHHNIRNAIEPWPKDNNISVGQYLLIEGLAEAFAAQLYGEDRIGPQTIGLVGADLEKAKQMILPHLEEKGFQVAQSYLFGDALADAFGYPKTGLPHGA